MSLNRPSLDCIWMEVAYTIAQRSTCGRRKVGCVLVNHVKQVVSTGYNGVPINWPHCTEIACSGAKHLSGTRLDLCEAVHAEQNAILQAQKPFFYAYCTTLPCVSCMKLFANTNIETIYYCETYPSEDLTKKVAEMGHIKLFKMEKPC